MRRWLLGLACAMCLAGCANPNDCPGIDDCVQIGYTPLDPVDCSSDECQWDQPTDERCVRAVVAMCACEPPEQACTEEDGGALYVGCHQKQYPAMLCRAQYVGEDGKVDCAGVKSCQ